MIQFLWQNIGIIIPVTFAKDLQQTAHKLPTIKFYALADYIVVFVLSFFERVFNCSLLLLDNGVA